MGRSLAGCGLSGLSLRRVFGVDLRSAPFFNSTAPTLQWEVTDQGTGQTQYLPASAGTVAVSLGYPIRTVLMAYDNGGVKRITLSGEGNYTCTSGALGESRHMLYATQEHRHSPNADNNVFYRGSVEMNQTYAWSCDPGWVYAGGNVSFSGEGENFYHGMAHASITLSVLPVVIQPTHSPTQTLGCANCLPVGAHT